MKKTNYKNKKIELESKTSWGEAIHELGKQTTEKSHNCKKDYKRKSKHKIYWLDDK
jgi:hypothetical protein